MPYNNKSEHFSNKLYLIQNHEVFSLFAEILRYDGPNRLIVVIWGSVVIRDLFWVVDSNSECSSLVMEAIINTYVIHKLFKLAKFGFFFIGDRIGLVLNKVLLIFSGDLSLWANNYLMWDKLVNLGLSSKSCNWLLLIGWIWGLILIWDELVELLNELG